MIARPSLVVFSLACAGGLALYFAQGSLAESHYGPAGVGAIAATLASLRLLKDLPSSPRHSLSAGAGILGFFVAVAATSLFHYNKWPVGFASAWLPAYLLFLMGFGRERLNLELSRLEDEIDDAKQRKAAIARAIEIRDAMLAEATSIDKAKKSSPKDPHDPRAVYAFAAQAVGYGYALDGCYADATVSLGAVPIVWMPNPMRLLMLSNLAIWQICAGKLEDAKKTIDAASEKDSLPETRVNLRATKALVLVLSEKPDEALEIVGKAEGDEGEPERMRARYTIVRAHAFAAKGENDKARSAIEAVLENPTGPDDLRRMLPAGGPAKALIEEVMRSGPAKRKVSADDNSQASAPSP